MTTIPEYLAANNDSYAPTVPNPSHQQWDNYGIYHLICVDVNYTETIVSRDGSISYSYPIERQKAFLAVQAYHPLVGTIPCDFTAIANAHP